MASYIATNIESIAKRIKSLRNTDAKWLLEELDKKKSAAVAKLSQTVSATPTQAEVQAISTKVDALIQALKDAGLMA